jgi:hypothetical protein
MTRDYETLKNGDRKRIIDLYLAGGTAITIASTFHFNRTTVHEVVQKYIKTGNIESDRKG